MISISRALSVSVPFILLMHLVNGAQFLNITPYLFHLVVCCIIISFSSNLIIPLTSMYASS